MANEILRYQQKCFATYSSTIGLPDNYRYLDGKHVRPVVPVETCRNSFMILGAYPSARFESREGRLVPVGDNLGPFQPELYFDGVRVRRQESAYGLEKYILGPLLLSRKECWITDLVKVFLFKPEHIANYKALGVKPTFKATRLQFIDYAKKSLAFLHEEVALAAPILVITLGEEVARVITGDFETSADKLLTGVPYRFKIGKTIPQVAHVAHPDACRRSEKWRTRTKNQMIALTGLPRDLRKENPREES